jgi:putative membrane protein insertion efficiency factor
MAAAVFRKWLVVASIGLIRAYQVVLGPILGGHCRYEPSCSVYALQVLQTHGFACGWWLALRRLLRCHPFAAGGFDPAPPARPR